jgi:hypothetical protein
VICVPILALAQQNKIFPYNYSIDELPNGLRLITVPTELLRGQKPNDRHSHHERERKRGRLTMLHRGIVVLFLFSFVFTAPLLAQRRRPMGTTANKNVLLPNKSPLVTFRILFMTGSAFDPPGKEGVASLTAAMLAQGGTRRLSYEQIVNQMYPLATSFEWQVDKEMTVFTGTTHIDNLEKYYSE